MGQTESGPAPPERDLATLFQFLDQEHRGFLTLKELIHASPDWALPHSIPALFYFDHEKNGTLSRDELGEIVGTCREEKRCALQNIDSNPAFRDLITRASAAGIRDCSKHGISSFRRLSNNCNIRKHYCRAEMSPRDRLAHGAAAPHYPGSDASSVASSCDMRMDDKPEDTPRSRKSEIDKSGGDSGFSSDDEAEDGYDTTDNARTPHGATTTRFDTGESESPASSVHGGSLFHDVTKKTVAMYCSQREFEVLKEGEKQQHPQLCGKASPSLDPKATTAVNAAVVDKVNKDFLRKMAAQLLNNDGAREQFMQWLWKLTDVSRIGAVDADDIGLLLQVLEEDGIDVTELVFEQDPSVPLRARILKEFQTSDTGTLSRDEFMVFADLVTREYEFWESRHLDCVGDYELGRTLGSGSSGIVRSAVHVDTKEKFAAKIIKKGNCSDLSRLDREIQSLQIMSDHPGVVDLHEVLETQDNLVLILELCGGGSLVDITRLYPDEKMPEDVARHFVSLMFDALASCHERGVCHRDVRLDNMLLDNNGMVKVTDFGHSGIFSPEWDIFQTSLVGSIYNLSPEQIAGQCYSGEKIDVWSAGIALYSLLVGRPPFFDSDTVQLLQSITTGTFTLPGFLSESAQNLIRSMIRVRREDRPSLRQCLQHDWFTSGPKTAPVMDVVNIPVDRFFRKRPDLAEMIVAGTFHEYRLHFHSDDGPDSDEESSPDWKLKCLCPNLGGIKFSIGLVTKPAAESEPEPVGEAEPIGRMESASPLSAGIILPKRTIVVKQPEGMIDESGYDEDDEEDARAEDHTTKGRSTDEPFTQIRRKISEYPSKRIAPAIVSPASPCAANATRVPSSPGGQAPGPAVRSRPKKGSMTDIRSTLDRFQPFVEVRLREGDAGLFLKVCRNLKKICDTKLANAASVYKSKVEGRRSGGLRRNVSDLFLRHDSTPTRSGSGRSETSCAPQASPRQMCGKPPLRPSPLQQSAV